MRKEWEYMFMTIAWKQDFFQTHNVGGVNEQQIQFNKFGDEGWELVYYHHLPGCPECDIILKREK